MVALTGIEPVLSALRGQRVNQLHHSAISETNLNISCKVTLRGRAFNCDTPSLASIVTVSDASQKTLSESCFCGNDSNTLKVSDGGQTIVVKSPKTENFASFPHFLMAPFPNFKTN